MTTVEPWRDHVAPGEEWRLDAACRDTDPDTFYPDQGQSLAPALRLCRICDVKAECLAFAVETRQVHGVWGGTSQKGRRPLLGLAPKRERIECVNGHSWLDPGSYHTRRDGHRVCRVCDRLKQQERKQRRKREEAA